MGREGGGGGRGAGGLAVSLKTSGGAGFNGGGGPYREVGHSQVCKGPQETQGQLAHGREQVGQAALGEPCRKLGHIYQAQNCFPAVFDRHVLKPGVKGRSAASTCHNGLSNVVTISRSCSHTDWGNMRPCSIWVMHIHHHSAL